IFSLLACQYGAGTVHAVEPNDAMRVAQALANANGYAERIAFHQSLSTDVVLPQPADVIISDLRSVLPLFEQHIPTIIDARERLLRPGGILIPQRDVLYAALVEESDISRRYTEPWLDNSYGLDLRAGYSYVANAWRRVSVKAENLLTDPLPWATLDYATIAEANVQAEFSLSPHRPGVTHGLLLWFDAELAPGIGFSNAPGAPELIYGQAFFPLQQPVMLQPQDHMTVRLRANLVNDDYVWRWDTTVYDATTNSHRATLLQSTALSVPVALEQLHRHEIGYVPRVTEAAEIDRFILAQIDGDTALGVMADRLMARFPGEFAQLQAALTRVAMVAERYHH
ncbi:MAG: class I SAM-dependent methyltransferase, partial [Caldilineaceae bacterium]|nr:class I SAM-dependent methyltransferase [Caldilineaceae bacterium]